MLTGPLKEHVDMNALRFNIDAGAFFAHFVKLILIELVIYDMCNRCPKPRARSIDERLD